jgi:hypothetical protein
MYAPSQPAPSVEIPFENRGLSSSEGAIALAPSFISWIARMNRNSAIAKKTTLPNTLGQSRPDAALPASSTGASAVRVGFASS